MRGSGRHAPPIIRDLASRPFAILHPEEAERGTEDGDLDGNMAYDDLRGMTWDDVLETLERERAVVAILAAAPDPNEAYEAFEVDRLSEWGADALWGLDPGVAAATITLSAMGAIPISSCNGGALGGEHLEAYPLVAFYVASASPDMLLACADAAQAGLVLDAHGCAQLFGQTCAPLLAFASAAIEHAK
jgi:hypothetical protein